MTELAPEISVAEALLRIDQAFESGRLSNTAVENLRKWLKEERYADYRHEIVRHVIQEQWQKLDDAFWTVIPFGTGGRRGRMYPIGSNAINDRTIGESAQGLADYIVEQSKQSDVRKPLSCAIAYDTRHRSREFAELCAGIMVASGFQVYFLDDYRATPQLSFAVRFKECNCGIMVTASHNPPSDNAVKVYWSTGGQVLPPHDKAIIERVMNTEEIRVVPFAEALADGRVEICTAEVDAAYLDAVLACASSGPRDLRILYSPLHGVGASSTVPVLQRDGFTQVEVYGPHAEPSADFPNVPGNSANPENVGVFTKPIEYAREHGFELVLATDPDADRLGVAAPLTLDASSEWRTLNGNQIGALLTDYVLSRRQDAGTLSSDNYVVKTLVTTELVRRIAEQYGVRCEGNLLVGFKWIAGLMDAEGPDKFVFGTEESHGYLVGNYVRDKDAPVACMLMCELAARLKSEGRTLHQQLDALYKQHGYHAEYLINVQMEGSEGMAAMQKLMAAFRNNPPAQLAGLGVSRVRDYLNSQQFAVGSGNPEKLDGPVGDIVILELAEEGNYVAVRPSGTEPKVKFYIFTRLSAAQSSDLEAAKQTLADRIARLDKDVRAFAGSA
ncbi:phospho-sugar mutase [Candidatus Laterigemmans baculatus]|uniref:phospho-sugar mutase n=1 Tax=Candidatus Laterigemmans baculatus TaxID=2770505 RepID=UPI0013DCB37E|nr:phospho-sugar mutase [Candidatus Laterigemmans baculatus]